MTGERADATFRGRFCTACGAPLPPEAAACPRCRRLVARRRSGAARAAAEHEREAGRRRRLARRTRETAASMGRDLRAALGLWFALVGVSLALLLGVFGRATLPAELVASVVMAVVVGAFAVNEGARLGPLLRRPGFARDTWWYVPAAFPAVLVSMTVYFALLSALGFHPASYLAEYRAAGWPLWSAFVLYAVVPAVFEELAFRGVIQTRLRGVMGRREAWLAQAGMFSILHLSPAIFPSHFAIGLLLGWLRNRTGSLWPGMVLHGTWNAWVLVEELTGLPWA